MLIDPRHLEQLAAIVDHGTLQEAANQIGTSQPALSRMIRTLEDRIGMQLFERSGRPLVATAIGRELSDQGRTIKAARLRAKEVIDYSERGIFGGLKIGAPPFLCERLVGEAISGFFKERPEIRIDLIADYFPSLQERITLNQIDLMICPIKLVVAPRKDLTIEPLFGDQNVVVAHNGHALSQKALITPEKLENVTWIGHSERSMLRSDMETALATIGATKLRFAFQSESAGAVLELLRNTDFLTVLPKYVFTEAPEKTGLTILPVELPSASRTVGMITQSDRSPNPLLENFKAHLRDYVLASGNLALLAQ